MYVAECVNLAAVISIIVERGGSAVECWTLNLENPGLNPFCRLNGLKSWAMLFSP